MEIIKNAIRVGNSAGVLLPREWLGSQVKVILEPLNIEKEVIEILTQEKILEDVLGVYIIGSYARNEQGIESDVDILVITNNTNRKIKKGKYEIICISKKELENQIEKNILPILPMLKEARAIINKELIKKYLSSEINLRNLKYHIITTKSAMKVVEKDIKFSRKMKENASDADAYSLILRLRTLYIVECLRKEKMWSKKDFLALIKNISDSLIAYERYLSSKNKKSLENKLPLEEAEKLLNYINKKTGEVEKWLRGKRG